MQRNSLTAERARQEFRRTWLSIPRFIRLKGKAELYTWGLGVSSIAKEAGRSQNTEPDTYTTGRHVPSPVRYALTRHVLVV